MPCNVHSNSTLVITPNLNLRHSSRLFSQQQGGMNLTRRLVYSPSPLLLQWRQRGGVIPTCCPSSHFIYPPNKRGIFFPVAFTTGAVWNPHAAPHFALLPPQQEGGFFLSGGVYNGGSVKSTRCPSFCFITSPASIYDRGSVKPTCCPSFCFITPTTSGGFFFRRCLWRGAVWNPHAALFFASLPPQQELARCSIWSFFIPPELILPIDNGVACMFHVALFNFSLFIMY